MPSLNTGNAILSNPIKVDSSYNVGIGGAASGSFKLQVTGASNFIGVLTATDGTQGLNIRAYTGGAGFGAIYSTGVTAGAGNFALAASATQTILSGVDSVNLAINSAIKFSIASSGNVGINTTSPSTRFELAGSSGNFQIASSGAEVFFTRDGNNDILANAGTSAGIRFGGQQQLRFATGSSLTTRLTIDSTGAATFSSSVTATKINIGTDEGYALNITTTGYAALFKSTGSSANIPLVALNTATSGVNNIMSLQTDAGVERAAFRYDRSGDRLQLVANGSGLLVTGFATFSSSVTMGGDLVLTPNDSAIAFSSGAGRFFTGGAERMRITSGGAVGFNGGADVTNVYDKFSMGYFNGNYGWLQTWNSTPLYFNKGGNAVYAGTQRIDNNSDQRIKENIAPIENALNVVLALNGRKFNMLDENGKLRYGFVAQEVQPHLADFVTESDRTFEKDDIKIENLLTLESSGAAWGALLVEAIKQQQAQIEELKALIASK